MSLTSIFARSLISVVVIYVAILVVSDIFEIRNKKIENILVWIGYAIVSTGIIALLGIIWCLE